MRAVQFPAVNEITLAEVAAPTPSPGEVLINLKAAALNRRDLWIQLGQYAGLKWPIIPGSDGAGIIAAVGEGVSDWAEGDEVIINASFDWGESEAYQGTDFTILGLPRDGTLAEQIAVPATQLAKKPAHLEWGEAAALPLAGLTAYRALFPRARLQAEEKVLVSGVGGGAAQFVLQYAMAAGAKVWVTSGGRDKIDRAVTLGARGGYNYKDQGWVEAAKAQAGGFDVIVDSAGGPGFGTLIDLANPGGRIVFFGATRGDPDVLPMRKVFWKQLSLLGTTMGSPTDWEDMLAFVARHQIKPIVSEEFALADAAAAFDLMARGDQFGKIVVKP